MNTIFEEHEVDYNTVQLLYGFVLIAAAMITIMFLGDIAFLGAVVAFLLLKDGLPNFFIGAKRVGEAMNKKKPEVKKQ